MSQILNKVRDVNPNDSDAVKEVLLLFFQKLPKYTQTDCGRWLQTLEDIINRFPKFCNTHRRTIEAYLTQFLETNNLHHLILTAKCVHALQQVKPSQDKVATPQACWREQMNILCHAAHLLIDSLFVESVNIYKNKQVDQISIKGSILIETALTKALININKNINGDQALSKKECQTIKLRNIFVFIQAMLVEIYPVAKPIRPQIILEVIVKVLSVTGNTVQDKCFGVTRVKIEALQTVNALIACLGANLIPFSALVFRLIMQTLRWSSENPSEESGKVRRAAYTSLSKWLKILHVHKPSQEGRGRLWEDELTKNILDDITPPKKVVQLTLSSQPNKKLSKKAKRRLANTMLQESAIASHMPGEKNKITASDDVCDDTAIAALECTETFLTVCGIFLKPATHKVLQERLVRECCALSTYSAERGLWLLRALESARKAVPPGVPPPTQYCLHLYSELLNTHQAEIQMLCSQALLDIRMHLYCSPPSLTFAIDVHPEARKKPESKKKMISERNRAVLASLLGAERMPTEDLREDNQDVISIPDEPTPKKPRLEDEITDRISLSSESAKSLEISDDSVEEEIIFQEVETIIEYRNGNADKKSSMPYEPEIEKLHSSPSKQNGDTLNDQANTKVCIEIDIKKPLEDKLNLASEKDNELVKQVSNNEEKDKSGIYEEKTQMPLNTSTEDTLDDYERPLSTEVAYDYPNTGKEVLTVLGKIDDENIPSSIESDDVQITCGQEIKASQSESLKISEGFEQEAEKRNGDEKADSIVPIENGTNNQTEIENKQVDIEASVDVSIKTVDKSEAMTLEDMLADFVDEVNEDSQIEA